MTKNILFILLALCISGVSLAQKNEFGIFMGSSGYHGDIGNEQIGAVLFRQSPAVGLLHKVNFHDFLSFRSSLQVGTLKANDAKSNNLNTQQRNLSFRSRIIDVNMGFEFNFYKFMIRKRRTVYSPYVFAGISFFAFNPQALNGNGQWIDLQPLGTEGQGLASVGIDKYSLVNWSIPFGLGYKANIGKKIAIGIEWVWRASQTDYLDDVSAYYVDESYLSSLAAEMANPGNNSITPGKSRGNPNMNDWYNFAGITFSYKIKNRPNKCPKALLP
jgi:hypothetical protein